MSSSLFVWMLLAFSNLDCILLLVIAFFETVILFFNLKTDSIFLTFLVFFLMLIVFFLQISASKCHNSIGRQNEKRSMNFSGQIIIQAEDKRSMLLS